jgi:hypothetical protein
MVRTAAVLREAMEALDVHLLDHPHHDHGERRAA